MAAFTSANAGVIKVDAKQGDFHAGAPGETTVTGSHAAAKQPAKLKLRSTIRPRPGWSSIRPPRRLAVHEQAALPLFLEVQDGGRPSGRPWKGRASPIGRPARRRAVVAAAVDRTGSRQALSLDRRLFPLYEGHGAAQVEVLPAAEPAGLRVVPAAASLAPGQSVSLGVQQQLPGSEQWKEVRPDTVSWTVPAEVIWEPASESLRPALTVPQDAKGEIQLRAEFAGREAVAALSVKPQGPDAADPAARLFALREPGGQYLPVGSQQRYTIMVEKDGHQEPATDVRWPGDFENQYVKWQAPVLTAKEAAGCSGSAPTLPAGPCWCTRRPTRRASSWSNRRSIPRPRPRS